MFCHPSFFPPSTSPAPKGLSALSHRQRPLPALAALTLTEAQAFAAPAGIRILELRADERNLLVLVSLAPTDSVSICASKLKGRLSKWLRMRSGLSEAENLLGRGYFACTSGHNTKADVTGYLDKQAAHHGYDRRVRPPVFVKEWEPTPAEEARLNRCMPWRCCSFTWCWPWRTGMVCR